MSHLSSLLKTTALAAGAVALAGMVHAADDAASYVAELQPMNAATAGSETTGEARFNIDGDDLVIEIDVTGAPAGITHWQHFHGFTTDDAAACAGPDADANGDGIVDLIETEPASGTTMVPFITDPASMDVPGGEYPVADDDGNYQYRATVSVAALSEAFAEAFDGQDLDLDSRVVLIHGVPEDTDLPDSVQSLGPIPASTTLPIACGKIVSATE